MIFNKGVCNVPLLIRMEEELAVKGLPVKSVILPPASVTMTMPATKSLL
jgi:hypothetical protein